MESVTLLAIVVAILYICLYLRGRYYLNKEKEIVLEKYENKKNCYTVLDTSTSGSLPYMTTEDKQGDFEGDFIYQNEGGPDPTRDAMNNARRRFPFDWSQLPPSSSLFQAQQSLFVKDPTSTASPFTQETFEDIESRKVLPPEDYEEDALKAYEAKMASDMKSVDSVSVNNLINDIYGKKGLVARVAKKANNVYEVYEVMEKEPTIVYEDELQQGSMQSNLLNPAVNPSEMLVAPNASSDLSVGLTPSVRGESVGMKRRTYDDYNPNLENMFGPKMQMQQWG